MEAASDGDSKAFVYRLKGQKNSDKLTVAYALPKTAAESVSAANVPADAGAAPAVPAANRNVLTIPCKGDVILELSSDSPWTVGALSVDGADCHLVATVLRDAADGAREARIRITPRKLVKPAEKQP
jgi:hypothetical protein